MLLAVRFVDESTGFLAPASVEAFRADIGIGYGTAAAMFVSYGLGGVVGNLAVAATDLRSRKAITGAGAWVVAASMLLLAGAFESWMLLAGTGLFAAGSTALVHGGEIAITNALAAAGEGHRLERVLARGNLGAVGGDVLTPVVLAGLRAGGVGWRPVFVGAAVAVALYAVLLGTLRFPDAVVSPARVDGDDAAMVPVHRQRIVVLLALAGFATMPLDEAYLSTVLAFAERDLGYTSAQAAALGVAFVIGGVLAFTVLPDRIAATPVPRLFAICGAGLSAVMLLAAIGPAWMLVPVGAVHSTLLSSQWLGSQAVVLRANPGREGRTKLVVELFEGTSLVLVVGFGLLADHAGLRAAMLAYASVPLLLVGAAMLLRRELADAAVSRGRDSS